MLYVLDTNTVSYFFRGEGKVAERIFECAPSEIAIPAVVEYEIRYGLAKAKRQPQRFAQLETFISSATILPFGSREAAASAEIRAALEQKGLTIGAYDILIAGTAAANSATLITRNTSEFKRIAGLMVENWF
jgi:tRNA(fMet)-specific endonuclease VapC